MKAGLKIFGFFVVIVIVGLACVPIFYDVNTKLKPEIQKAIEKSLNAKVEIGKLSLSALFGINVGVESLRIIENEDDNVFFEMKDAKLKIPILSLLTGKLSVTLNAHRPIIRLNKDKEGKLNVSKLLKTSDESAKQGAATAAGAESSFGLGRVAFSTDITDASIEFKDKKSGAEYKINELNFVSHNIGLGKPFETTISANLSVDNKKDIRLKGKLSFDGKTEIEASGQKLDGLSFKSRLDLTDLEIEYLGLLNKGKGIPLSVDADVVASSDSLRLQSVELLANTFKIKAAGTVTNFDHPNVDVKISSNQLKLQEWKKIIKPLKELDIEGNATFDLAILGAPGEIEYSGSFDLKDSSMKIPGLVPRATEVTASLNVKTDELSIQKAAIKIGSSDLSLSGTVKNFSAPAISLTYFSKKLDLDEMLPQPSKQKAAEGVPSEDPRALEKSLAQLEGPITLIQKNPILRNMNLRAQTTIDSLIIKGAEIAGVKAPVRFNGLVLTMENALFGAFGGSGTTDLRIDFSQKKPVYSFKAKVQKLDTNKAMVSQFKELDKTLTGMANANFEVHGVGVTLEDLNKHLAGRGSMNVQNGSWSGLGVLKMIGEKLKSIPKVAQAVSGIKITDKFKVLKSDFTIGGGRFNIQNGIMEMESANTMVTLNGFIAFTKDMNMRGEVVAPMGQVPKKMATSDGRGKIPYEIKGRVNDPKVDWDATLKPVAMAFAQQEGQKFLKKEVDKLKNDGIKKLFKGLKF